MYQLRVRVEQRHIDAGTKGNSQCCPIALAVREEFPRLPVMVTDSRVYLAFKRFILNDESKAFIENFDIGLPVEPCAFQLQNDHNDYKIGSPHHAT